jgi:hypothetical protein
VGTARIEQPGRLPRSALILSGVSHRADSVMASLLAATVTWARDSVAAAQAIAAIAWRPSSRSRWQVEAGGSGSEFALSRVGAAGNLSAWVRGRFGVMPGFGVLAGATGGYTARRAVESRSVTVEAGAWATPGPFLLELTALRTRTEDSLLMAASRVYTRRVSDWLDVDDVAASASWAAGPVAFGAAQRWRTGVRGTVAAQTATTGSATWTVSPRVALVTTAGRQLADPARGAPDATVYSALLRLTFGGQADTVASPPPSEVTVNAAPRGAILIVRVRAAVGARVEVAGSFSNWDPVPLELRNGYWEARAVVAPGRYRVAYRVDGGPWRAPSGVARLREFGGEVGLIVVP